MNAKVGGSELSPRRIALHPEPLPKIPPQTSCWVSKDHNTRKVCGRSMPLDDLGQHVGAPARSFSMKDERIFPGHGCLVLEGGLERDDRGSSPRRWNRRPGPANPSMYLWTTEAAVAQDRRPGSQVPSQDLVLGPGVWVQGARSSSSVFKCSWFMIPLSRHGLTTAKSMAPAACSERGLPCLGNSSHVRPSSSRPVRPLAHSPPLLEEERDAGRGALVTE